MSAVIIAAPWIDFSALWKIIVVGLLAGAGLPAIFAVGLRALSFRSGVAVKSDVAPVYSANPAGLAAGGLCFAVVLAAIGWGIYSLVNAS